MSINVYKLKAKAAGGSFGAGRPFVLLETEREATGHGIFLDAKTGAGVVSAVMARSGGRVKAYATHDHRGPGSSAGEPGTELSGVIGIFSGVRIDGRKVVADHFEFLPSFVADEPAKHARIADLLAAEVVTVSLELAGRLVYVDAQGAEHANKKLAAQWRFGGMPVLRVEDVFGAALVSAGAATSSLFTRAGDVCRQTARALRALFGHERNPWAPATRNYTEQAQLSIKSAELAAKLKSEAGSTTPTPSRPGVEPMSRETALLDDVRKRFSADAPRMVRALELMANSTFSDVSAIERELLIVDLREAQHRVSRLEADLATANANACRLIDERDAWKSKFFAIKDSGAPAVNLGTPSAGADFTNPWAEGSKNYTEQAAISLQDPKLAEMLKAAAGRRAA